MYTVCILSCCQAKSGHEVPSAVPQQDFSITISHVTVILSGLLLFIGYLDFAYVDSPTDEV